MNQERKIGTLLALATEQGRITTAQHTSYLTLAKAEYEATCEALAGIPITQAAAKDGPRQRWGFGEWRKFDPNGLNEMEAKAPSRYAALKDLYLAELRQRGR